MKGGEDEMKHSLVKKLTGITTIIAGWFYLTVPAFAQVSTDYTELDSSLGTSDPVTIALNLINMFLALLALIAVIMIIIGGAQWLTAGGAEEKIEAAKKRIVAAIIGIVIILLAWALTTWVIGTIGTAAETDTTSTEPV